MYPEDSNRRTRLYSQVIDPKNTNTLGLKRRHIKKLRNRSRKRSKFSNRSRLSKFSNSSGEGRSTSKMSHLNSSNNSHKNISSNSICSKNSIKSIRSKVSHTSLIKIPTIILNKDDKKVEKTVRLSETDNSNFATPKPIIQLSKTKIMFDKSKFRKLSTTDQIEEVLSSQKSILDGIEDTDKNL